MNNNCNYCNVQIKSNTTLHLRRKKYFQFPLIGKLYKFNLIFTTNCNRKFLC